MFLVDSMQWGDPAVQAAVIQAIGAVIATSIAALSAAILGRQIAARRRLEEKLQMAQGDVCFLLEVEKTHCRLHQEKGKESNKLRVRKEVQQRGYVWSGRFTPSRIRAKNPSFLNGTSPFESSPSRLGSSMSPPQPLL
jgi:hypothetical protein